MRAAVVLLAGLLGLPGCVQPQPASAPYGIGVRIRGSGDEIEPGPLGVDPRMREKDQARRFPGVRKLGLVKVVISPLDRSGPCWTELATARETDISVEEAVNGDAKTRSALGVDGLVASGWRIVYRTPGGLGFERQVKFRSVDLAVGIEARCRCSAGAQTVDGDRKKMALRFRWKEGEMPQVSAKVSVDGKVRGLRPALTSGAVLGWEFTAAGSFPEGNTGRCGARMDLVLLVEPAVV